MLTTMEVAKGRWRQILLALGVKPELLSGKQQACPRCGGFDRFVYDDKTGNGDFICRQCSAGQGVALLMLVHGWTYKQAADKVDAALQNLPEEKPQKFKPRTPVSVNDVFQLWRRATPLDNDAATVYLAKRGIQLPEWPRALRFVAKWRHTYTSKYLPCLCGLWRDQYGTISTIHRTFLADVEPRRMFLARPVAKGGAIWLGEPSATMGVAEGIETALSASLLHDMPVWATCSEALLRAWEPPPQARNVWVFGDNDKSFVGQRAAYELAWRLTRKGLNCKVELPSSAGWDFNDVLKNEIETERYQLAVPQLRSSDSDQKPSSKSISDADRRIG